MDCYVFGGFASTPWASRNSSVACANAFIFSLHHPGRAGPVVQAVDTDTALYDGALRGPNFGQMDIELRVSANMGVNNFTSLAAYVLPPGHQGVDAKAFFTGSKKFRAAEVEVFSVTV